MSNPTFWSYARIWIKTASAGLRDVFDTVTTAVSLSLWIWSKVWPNSLAAIVRYLGLSTEAVSNDWIWALPLTVVASRLIYRVIRAPYELHRANQNALDEVQKDRDDARNELAAALRPRTTNLVESLQPLARSVARLVARRGRHLSVPLKDGRVLVVGGLNENGIVETAEAFDRRNGTFSTMEWFAMDPPVPDAAVALLPDGTLVFAGDRGRPQPLTVVKFAAGRPAVTRSATPSATQHNVRFTMTTLDDGRVLLIGSGQSTMSKGTEIYDPATGTFKKTADLRAERLGAHTATQLRNGSVLIVGGSGGGCRRAEIYNLNGTVVPAADLIRRRRSHTATRLANGHVLIVGGLTSLGEGATSSWDSGEGLIEFYDPGSGYFELVDGVELTVPRWDHTATLLPDGSVLVVGGFTKEDGHAVTTDVVERYLPNTRRVEVVGKLHRSRGWHTTELLDNGTLLVIGGAEQKAGQRVFLNDVEVLPPLDPPQFG